MAQYNSVHTPYTNLSLEEFQIHLEDWLKDRNKPVEFGPYLLQTRELLQECQNRFTSGTSIK